MIDNRNLVVLDAACWNHPYNLSLYPISSIAFCFYPVSSIDLFCFPGQIISQQLPGMNILVAVDAEVLPVAAVGGIVEVVPVLMVYRQQLSLGRGELPAAAGADQTVKR